MDKENKSKQIQIKILIIIVGSGVIFGAFFLGKLLGRKSIESNPNTNLNNTQTLQNGEIDLSNNLDLINKFGKTFKIPTKLLNLLRNGQTANFSDFTKVYFTLYNLIDEKYACDESKVDICINESILEKKTKDIFGNNVNIKNSNYKEFKNYSFGTNNNIAYYDDKEKIYIIKNILNNNIENYNDYILIPYRLIQKDKTYYLTYYIIYREYDNNEYIYYTNENKKTKIFVLNEEERDNYKNRIINSSIKKDFTKITLTFKKDENRFNFLEFERKN